VAVAQLYFYAGINKRKLVIAMGLGDLVQKAVYLGIGLASYAGEKAGGKLSELRVQVQKMADEMVERGEMTAEEARKFVDDMVGKAQQPSEPSASEKPAEPRRIEIVTDDEETAQTSPSQTEEMRRQVMELQEELRRLRQEKP
jgi:polyhydroxyalkanoate synthesis regulator phasin